MPVDDVLIFPRKTRCRPKRFRFTMAALWVTGCCGVAAEKSTFRPLHDDDDDRDNNVRERCVAVADYVTVWFSDEWRGGISVSVYFGKLVTGCYAVMMSFIKERQLNNHVV